MMKILNTLLLLIVGIMWMAPGAFAFYPDEEPDGEKSGMIREFQLERAYREMVEEKKKLMKEAAPVREKRKATLTPFVYDTPKELADLEEWKKSKIAEKNRPSKKASKVPLVIMKTDVNKEISENILINCIVIFVCITGSILFLIRLRIKNRNIKK